MKNSDINEVGKDRFDKLCQKLADMVKDGPDGQIIQAEAYEKEAYEIFAILGLNLSDGKPIPKTTLKACPRCKCIFGVSVNE